MIVRRRNWQERLLGLGPMKQYWNGFSRSHGYTLPL